MIKCLSAEVRGKLRSGVSIPSLQQCVEELLLNSIDAEATCVGVRMDMEAFKVQVIDNGAGMSSDDMESVGNRYHTSKCSSVEDLEELRWFGFRGEALASIVSLSTLVEISSRAKSSTKTHVRIFRRGTGMDVFEAEADRPSVGTTVTVCNFFHSMPVRRKRMDAVLEGERIRNRVEAISLMHPLVSFTLKNDCTGTMMVQLPKARNIYHRFVQIHGFGKAQKLGEISHSHHRFEVTGYLGKEGHYNNSLQFLYVNDRLLLKTRIHKLLNSLLRRLGSSTQKQDSPDGSSVTTRSTKVKKSQETYGVFILNIKCAYSEYDICLEPAKTLIEFKDWDGILLCVEEAVKAYMNRENLVPVLSLDDMEEVSSEAFVVTGSTEQEETRVEGGQTTTDDPILGSYIGARLASESVHRKRTADGSMDNKEDDDNNEGSKKEALDDSVGIEEEECSKLSNDLNLVQDFIQQAHHDSSCTEIKVPENLLMSRDGSTLKNNKKICVLSPYIHESLKPPDIQRTNRSTIKHKEQRFPFKRKISLVTHGRSNFTALIPQKIPKISTCKKLAIEDFGSLDKFRRIYMTSSDPIKPLSIKNQGDIHSCSSVFNSEIESVVKDDEQHGSSVNTQEETEADKIQVNAPSLSPTPKQKGESSLATKLCHLKQRKNDAADESQVSTSDVNVQDGNNNDGLCDYNKTHEANTGDSKSFKVSENKDEAPSRDWLRHYETTVGKNVYVNRVTGLSRYEEPTVKETQVQCTSDVTNVAVSVFSEMGMECTCYPFQMDVVLPFLPKSRPERVISSGLICGVDAEDGADSLSLLYSKWNNPVFVRPPMVGVDISNGQADGLVVKIHNVLYPYRFSKSMIHSMKVIHQVDKKFLACLIDTKDAESVAQPETGHLLVLVDQHAAHERVRLENLVEDSYEDDPESPGERRLCAANILPPLRIDVTEEELRLLRSCQRHLRSLGLEVTFSEDSHVLVGKVPLCFTERESNELRRGRTSVIKPIVVEYLREQTELLRSTGRVRGTLPLTVLKVLASLACHGAVKFNHSLSRDECHSLVASLSSCQLPFQCAHGRPSIVPLVDVLHLDRDQKELQKPNFQKLRRMYKAWKLYGNG
ncbi:DNA mismatch repair protein Mlh3 isoform X2 [Gouania willdenowi]|uniref:DNA mismatch repair protein Mlh3 isoform X2 n=1 Tax=Gouania willdenowi TaxID=441366 RepID=UPI0010562EC9|nr:DNA mismatch repair protein Mlh3 isoform X2 [Gouania willdenowi]